MDAVGAEVLARLKPLAGGLADQVVGDVERRLDLLDRLGLLWKLAVGDGKGLTRKLVPVAEESVERWWEAHQGEVLTAVGDGIAARSEALEGWLLADVLPAAREEILEPALRAQGERLEREAEGAIEEVLSAVVSAPEGGFRVRFAAVLRSRLLGKDEPLLLLSRER